MEIKTVGVVGCGMMGSGIAQICAQAGYQVIVSEINDEMLKKGLNSIDEFMTKGIERGKLTADDKKRTLERIKGTTSMNDFESCQLVIEAALEKMDIKKAIFSRLDEICPKDTILTTNTSAMSVIGIASATKRLDKVAGTHFFSPAQIMKLLEVIKTLETSDMVIDILRKFGASIGKHVILAPDTPGFIVNRLLTPFLIHAAELVQEGVASPEDIDAAVTLGLNHPMGPLALLDWGSIDLFIDAANAKYEELHDPRYAPPVILKKMVAAGRLGRKSGRGFFDYTK